ncbi:hypothetical protein JHK85_044832 [Glycine max]|nr:hypothetical protein JHK85_044832 [Glycine max]
MMMMVEGRLAREVGSFLEFGEEVDKEGTSVYVGALLPDELVERILAYLPPLQAFSEQDVKLSCADCIRYLPLLFANYLEKELYCSTLFTNMWSSDEYE